MSSLAFRLVFLALIACSLVALEGCATTQVTKTASKRKKSKRIKKPKPIEGTPIAFKGDELDSDDDDSAADSDDDEQDEEGDLTAIMVTEGHASFYHDSLAGRATANGEKYDPNAKTCAHKTLPFGTMLVVEDPSTGKKSTCRVNDRGPFVGGRIIDLSKRVARELGIVDKGITKVRIRILPKVAS
jgi:rare lipoprotein A